MLLFTFQLCALYLPHVAKQLLAETLDDIEVGDGGKNITEAEAEYATHLHTCSILDY